jgi:Tfp pilus assembly protein PilF
MTRLFTAALIVAAMGAAAHDLSAQQIAPRDLWPQAAAAAADGDLDAAERQKAALIQTGKTYGIRSFPLYASAAAGMASEFEKQSPQIAAWAVKAAAQLDPQSPAVAFSEADRMVRNNQWPRAITHAANGLLRMAGDYRSNVLGRTDGAVVLACTILATAIIFAIALFLRYGRSMAHDFREWLSQRISGGSVTVLSIALLFLPLFLWLSPVWLLLYWFVLFFGYAEISERIFVVILLLLVAFVPLMLDFEAARTAGIENPLMTAALASRDQAYDPSALPRLQELVKVAPENATLQLLLGNMQAFEGQEELAAQSYRKAIELRSDYAGAHVNLGNLLFSNNEFQAALTEYEKAFKADPDLAIAYYNSSVASGETYKFDQQAQMLDQARKANRSLIEKLTRNPPSQKVVMYSPPIDDAWAAREQIARKPAASAQFGGYARFDLKRSALNPLTLGALAALLLAVIVWARRRRSGYANACIKCGRTFCHRCKSSRESSTYCTQCIHIYLKRDGVSLDTKRRKLDEVGGYQTAVVRRNRLFAAFLPGSAQLLEGRTVVGTLGLFFFSALVTIAILVGRLAPALGPAADFTQLLVRIAAIAGAVVMWLFLSVPVFRRKAAA